MTQEDDKDSDLKNEEDKGKSFIHIFFNKLFPAIFVKAIMEAESDNERQELAESFGGRLDDYDSIKDLFYMIADIQYREKREEDAKILLKYAKVTSNSFLHQKTQKVKNGLSLQYMFNGKVIASIGHALNEGFTERTGRSVMDKYVEQVPSFTTPEEYERFKEYVKGRYLLEVKFADKLVDMFGEQLVGRAYFGDFDDLESLMRAVDERLGEKAYVQLLLLSDAGEWREVFSLLR
jgi:hypothetical protein